MWELKYDGPGWIYSKPGSTIELRYESGQVLNLDASWWFPVKPTKKQLRQARKNKLH
ncbi:DUF7279 family protein [Klebsiella michiganensis]|uniref:DUF7279 family protein n=1 Tax=Klebsiella michiganensis TaxID=1134687 RepID=UPI003BFA796B